MRTTAWPGRRALATVARPDTTTAARPARWPLLLAPPSLLLGLALWLTLWTDYQATGALADLLLAPLAALLALWTWRRLGQIGARPVRLAARLACLPALAGGGAQLVLYPLALAGIVMLPIFTTRLIFSLDERLGEVRIQQVVSPDGTRVANVYYQPVGSYGGGDGRVAIRVQHAWLPLLERAVYNLPTTRTATGQPQEYVAWRDADTLQVAETRELIDVGTLRRRLAPPLAWAAEAWARWQWERDPAFAAPLADLPRYPARVVGERQYYHVQGDSLVDYARFPGQSREAVAAWYRGALALAPWQLVEDRTNRRRFSSERPEWVSHCLTATRALPDGSTRAYSFEIQSFDAPGAPVWVNAATPHPVGPGCPPWLRQLSE